MPETATTCIEQLLWRAGLNSIAGVDEAGRGAWAGPVVAAAVVLDPARVDRLLPSVRDSKLLTPPERAAAAELVRAEAVAIGTGCVPSEVVDRAGLAFAGQLAFWRAVRALPLEPDYLLVDGFPLWSPRYRQAAVLQGDRHCLSIAAASVVAKVERDALMGQLDRCLPDYGFGRHKGYGSPSHARALRELGPTDHHRRSFQPVALALGGQSPADGDVRPEADDGEFDESPP